MIRFYSFLKQFAVLEIDFSLKICWWGMNLRILTHQVIDPQFSISSSFDREALLEWFSLNPWLFSNFHERTVMYSFGEMVVLYGINCKDSPCIRFHTKIPFLKVYHSNFKLAFQQILEKSIRNSSNCNKSIFRFKNSQNFDQLRYFYSQHREYVAK